MVKFPTLPTMRGGFADELLDDDREEPRELLDRFCVFLFVGTVPNLSPVTSEQQGEGPGGATIPPAPTSVAQSAGGLTFG